MSSTIAIEPVKKEIILLNEASRAFDKLSRKIIHVLKNASTKSHRRRTFNQILLHSLSASINFADLSKTTNIC